MPSAPPHTHTHPKQLGGACHFYAIADVQETPPESSMWLGPVWARFLQGPFPYPLVPWLFPGFVLEGSNSLYS